jgi:ceramide glucosyltransferase
VPSPASCSELLDEEVPHVTILRPVKSLDPWLYECLAPALQPDYPPSKLIIYICVSSRNDPAFPVLKQLLADFLRRDARIFVDVEENADASASDSDQIHAVLIPRSET